MKMTLSIQEEHGGYMSEEGTLYGSATFFLAANAVWPFNLIRYLLQ